MSKKLYDLVAKVMNVQSSTINDESGPESIENWTSFKGYVLLYEAETEFKVKFTINEAMDVKKIADIKRHLKNHGAILND
ncbi:acyl carrier protein [Candidatus Nitrosotenuis chungbukensis]|uniref:acyl carrier protein n=1 Tax=Candidatus Nitrosotenuis chungbukensis TaxID=1353246 RepID=UPI0026737D94|nr:acyl carrier protein [Candidatus Nitrosotenuis chungbukensis]WKT58311.1 acyl carrier protein [Candidatus Nitrosotenuis chungbukensis]